MGLQWVVEYDKHLMTRHQCFGLTDYPSAKILLQSATDGHCARQVELTFKHELVHACLFTLNEHDLNQNEKFVDTFGNLLLQFDKTRKAK